MLSVVRDSEISCHQDNLVCQGHELHMISFSWFWVCVKPTQLDLYKDSPKGARNTRFSPRNWEHWNEVFKWEFKEWGLLTSYNTSRGFNISRRILYHCCPCIYFCWNLLNLSLRSITSKVILIAGRTDQVVCPAFLRVMTLAEPLSFLSTYRSFSWTSLGYPTLMIVLTICLWARELKLVSIKAVSH